MISINKFNIIESLFFFVNLGIDYSNRQPVWTGFNNIVAGGENAPE